MSNQTITTKGADGRSVQVPHAAPAGFDKSAERTAPTRRLEIRVHPNGGRDGYVLVAVTTRPEGGQKSTLLACHGDARFLLELASATARGIEHVSGAMFSYPQSISAVQTAGVPNA